METEMNTVQKGYKIYKFNLTVFSTGNGICSSGWPWATASCSAFDQTGLVQLSQKSSNVRLFNFC